MKLWIYDCRPASEDWIWIKSVVEHVTTLRFTCPIQLHSQNPVGIQNMRAIIQHNDWKEI